MTTNECSDFAETIEYAYDDEIEVDFESFLDLIPAEPGFYVIGRNDILRAIEATTIGGGTNNYDETSREEALRIAALRRLLDQYQTLYRPWCVGNEDMIAGLQDIKTTMPNFNIVTDMIIRTAVLSMTTSAPMVIPPICLLGRPGIGKSCYSTALAQAISTNITVISGATLADRGTLTGLGPVWRGARPGAVARALLAAKTASPVILLDEVDKMSGLLPEDRLLDCLLPLLETATAREFSDDYLGVPMRADPIVWIMTANDISQLPAPLCDRLVVINIPEPTSAERAEILRRVFEDMNQAHANIFSKISDEALDALAESNTRRAKLVLKQALAYAAVADRRHVTVDDIAAAIRLVGGASRRHETIGFQISSHPAVSVGKLPGR